MQQEETLQISLSRTIYVGLFQMTALTEQEAKGNFFSSFYHSAGFLIADFFFWIKGQATLQLKRS